MLMPVRKGVRGPGEKFRFDSTDATVFAPDRLVVARAMSQEPHDLMRGGHIRTVRGDG
jgi:hypothetical protein